MKKLRPRIEIPQNVGPCFLSWRVQYWRNSGSISVLILALYVQWIFNENVMRCVLNRTLMTVGQTNFIGILIITHWQSLQVQGKAEKLLDLFPSLKFFFYSIIVHIEKNVLK